MKVKDKVAFITGGTGGLGAEAARLLAHEGATVVVTDLARDAGEQLAAEVNGFFFEHDVTNFQQWQSLADRVVADHGQIDILLQCAGIEGDLTRDVLHTEPENWRKVIEVNLTGTFYGCRTIIPHMRQRGSGSVINISSIASFVATSGAAAYGASKAGVQHLTSSVAVAAAQDGRRVRVNSVHPGVIKTSMTDRIIETIAENMGFDLEAAEAQLMSGALFPKRGTPRDVANLVLFLASEESQYVTGSAFQIDGGLHIKNAA